MLNKLNKLNKLKIVKVDIPENQRLARIGVGKHEGVWFFRIDLWNRGYRIQKK